jgi:hypothetical protein
MTEERFIIPGTDMAYCAKHPGKKYNYKKYDKCWYCHLAEKKQPQEIGDANYER